MLGAACPSLLVLFLSWDLFVRSLSVWNTCAEVVHDSRQHHAYGPWCCFGAMLLFARFKLISSVSESHLIHLIPLQIIRPFLIA